MTDKEWLAAEFERCWAWLAAAVERYGPTHHKEHVWDEIESGKAQLWPLPNGAMVTTIRQFPTGFTELVGWLAGGDLTEIRAGIPAIEDWAIRAGCHRAVIHGRRGWVRSLTGYEPVVSTIKKDLI